MAFLNFMRKREELPTDIDLDIPPEPPKMMEEDVSIEESIDEELMPIKKKPNKLRKKVPKVEKEEVPELPPLPSDEELESLPELPPLAGEEGEELPPLPEIGGEEELPPPPLIEKEKRGFFSFLKQKKAAKELELPELPPLPEVGGEEAIKEFPEIPPLPEKEEFALGEEEERPAIPPIGPLKPEVKPIPWVKGVEKPIKKFVTINDFKQIQGDISDIKDALNGVDDVFDKLEEVKGGGDKAYGGLYNSLKDIQTKIMFVDKSLFKEESV